MKILTDDHVHAALRFPEFIDALQAAFAGDFTMPPRQVLALDPSSDGHEAFAMLPSWNEQVIALKAFTYFPRNASPLRTLYSKILVFDRAHGEPLALVDGSSVTYWRTAGVSALASRFLSRPESWWLLVLGERASSALFDPGPCQRAGLGEGHGLGAGCGEGGGSGRTDGG